ncbi:MAG: hypothetical protein HWD86_03390 [Kangiellaceae bacterium]|nr:hypothetical protein [Kangiellaceae bacterium]
MSRLLYESDHLYHLEDTYHDLQNHGVKDEDLHVVSNQDGKVLRHGLNAANAWYRTNIIHSAIRGLIIGLLIGLAIAFSAIFASSIEAYYGTAGFVLTVLFCTGFGVWLGGFIGLQKHNYKLKRYFKYVDDGNFLLLIDTKPDEIDNIHNMMKSRHPQLKLLSDDVETAIPIKIMQTSH